LQLIDDLQVWILATLIPTLHLSEFLEKNKSHYYDNLMRVRTHNDLNQWLKFFLEGVRSTAENSIQTCMNIITLREELENKIVTLGKRHASARAFLVYLYRNPATGASDAAEGLDVNISTVLRLIEDFVNLDILVETTGYKRNRIFAFDDYLKLFR